MNGLPLMKKIPGFSRYSVTKDGRVYDHTLNKFRKVCDVRKAIAGSKPYQMVGLYNDAVKRVTQYVHRLLAVTYLPNPDSLNRIRHKDGNTLNNVVRNLQWYTNRVPGEQPVELCPLTKVPTRLKEGVLWCMKGSVWNVDHRQQHIGRFKDASAAFNAYRNACR